MEHQTVHSRPRHRPAGALVWGDWFRGFAGTLTPGYAPSAHSGLKDGAANGFNAARLIPVPGVGYVIVISLTRNRDRNVPDVLNKQAEERRERQ